MTDDPEDIFSSSLGTLFDYMTVAHSSPGSEFVYTSPDNEGVVVTLTTPDSAAQNWTLHASSIWVASIFIADHIHELNRLMRTDECETQIINVLELGAGAGLPSILLAKTRPNTRIVCSDYPDAAIIRALRGNLACNGVAARCTVVPFAWGSDPAALLAYAPGGFDCLLAADTLWDPDSHELLVDTIAATLSRQASARAHLVAGLHTGRYTIESFLARARQRGFLVVSAVERQVVGEGARGLDVYREESEDDKERRRWVVWIQLSWAMDWEVQQM